MRSGNDSESDDTGSEASGASSNTIRAETSSEEENAAKQQKTNNLSQLPSELRNRVLMLTSRGVSYRWDASESESEPLLTSADIDIY